MRLHLIDTDVFIRANREHYGLDYCPAFWDWLGFHGQAGKVRSVKIPNACRALGVRCMDPWTMLRMIGARFILDQGGRTVPSDRYTARSAT